MNEHLLESIIRLMAILAKSDGVEESEVRDVSQYLEGNLSDVKAAAYKEKFLRMTQEVPALNLEKLDADGLDFGPDLKEVADICSKINSELSATQKVVLMIDLLVIILADGSVSREEEVLVKKIGRNIKLDEELISDIFDFSMLKEPKEFRGRENFLWLHGPEAKPVKDLKTVSHEHVEEGIIFMQVPSLEVYFLKKLGHQELYLNGVPLREQKPTIFSQGSSIRADLVSPIYFSDIIAKFKDATEGPTISFSAEDVFFQFPNGNLGLRDINIQEKGGRLIGIMGGSGAGKSTLFNVMNGNETPSQGQVKINNIDIHRYRSQIEGVIGYVPQDDLLIEDLTVFENLYYAGKLCFDDMGDRELKDLVDLTLKRLGLTATRNLKVGSPLQKTISGGQRKRLNIGLELLREPAVMFVDEPTSGLSSRDSENIMDLLKELSLRGKMIFVVIHQPSSEIFKMFDKLVILDVGGLQIYYGHPVEAVVYFKKLVNLIDADHGECHSCGSVNVESIFNIIETKVVDEYGSFTDERKVSPKQWRSFFEEHTEIKDIAHENEHPGSSLQLPSKLKQSAIFLLRDVKSKLSNKQYLLINLLEAPVLAFILGWVMRYHSEGAYHFADNPNMPSFYFISVVVALFMGLTVSAEEIIKDKKIRKRERFLNLSRSSYLSSKVFMLFVLSAFQTATYVVVATITLELASTQWHLWLVLFSTSCFANMLGLNISAGFNSAVTIYIIIPLLIIPQLLLSGVVVSFDKLNPVITSRDKVPFVGELMASRWAFEAAMVGQFRHNHYGREFYDIERKAGNAEYKAVYYISELKSAVSHLTNNLGKPGYDPEEDLKLLKHELAKELRFTGEDKLPEWKLLEPDKVDILVLRAVDNYLDVLEKVYVQRYNEANSIKERAMANMTATPEKRDIFQHVKETHFNAAISDFVLNRASLKRIERDHTRLVRKMYPAYMRDEHPHRTLGIPGTQAFDIRVPFFAGEKHFAGRYYDTSYFNLVIIWLMTVLLYITLYFDLLRKVVETRVFKRTKG